MEETKKERRLRQGRETKARWRAANPGESRARANAWAAKNREYARAKSAKWREDNPERTQQLAVASRTKRKTKWTEFLAYERARYRKNPTEKLAKQAIAKAADPAKFAKVLHNHYLKNKAAYLAKSAERRVLRLRATPTVGDKAAIVALFRKAQRLTKETGVPHEVDHIIPLQGRTVSGLHVIHNMQIITRLENRRKHNKIGG